VADEEDGELPDKPAHKPSSHWRTRRCAADPSIRPRLRTAVPGCRRGTLTDPGHGGRCRERLQEPGSPGFGANSPDFAPSPSTPSAEG
jgi:hypothetical protein